MESESTEEIVVLDVSEIDRLLDVLRQKDVHSFQGLGITVVFNEKPEYMPGKTVAAAKVEDDGHSTSTKRVDGFKNPFQHEALWQHQNGKVMRFDGRLE